MGWGGMLASAFAGAAGAVNEQARGDIEQKRRIDIAQEMSKIEEARAMRLAEAQEKRRRDGVLWGTTGEGGEAKLSFDKRQGEQASAQAVEQAKQMGPVAAENAGLRIRAETEAAAEQAKKQAADPTYLAAVNKLKLADPEVAARIAAAKAAANSSGAHAGLLAAQTAGVKLDIEDKKKLNSLYDKASDILTSDKYTTEEARAKAWNDNQKQITLIKSKTGQASGGKDPEIDTETIVTKKMDPSTGEETTTTRKQVRRPGAGGKEEAEDPILSQLKANRAVAAAKGQTEKPAEAKPMVDQTPNAIDQQIYSGLAPLAAEYKQAKSAFEAAARSQDATAIARYQEPMMRARQALEQAAEQRLGNGAPRYLKTVL